MNANRIALAVAATFLVTSAVAAPVKATYSVTSAPGASSTGGPGTNNGTTWNNTSATAYGPGGTNYGNTFSGGSLAGNGPALTLSAWGSTGTTATSTIQKAWIGNYGSYGLGVTSQSLGELNGSNIPDEAYPLFQHAIDNTNSYESLMFSFASSVTLNDVSIGFAGADADATVLAYVGSGDPNATNGTACAGSVCATSGLTNSSGGGVRTYADLLSSGQWVVAGNLMNMSSNGTYALSTTVASKYWMVGAYAPFGSNASLNDKTADQFKLTGVSATRAVPEPESLALFAIAGLAMVAGRRRATRQA